MSQRNLRPRTEDYHASQSHMNIGGNALSNQDTEVPRLQQDNLFDNNLSLCNSAATSSSTYLTSVEDNLTILDRNFQVNEQHLLEFYSFY